MKKITAGLLSLLVILFVSCQKEIDWGLGGGSAADKLLVKIKSKTGVDSSVILYSYNTARQLIGENITGMSGTTNLDNDLKIFRNNSGIILKTVQVSATLVAAGVDSVVTIYNYNATTSQYKSSVFTITILGFSVADSAAYTYDASGKITGDEHYLKTGFLPPLLSLKNQYSYSADGLNLTGLQQLASLVPGDPLTPVSAQTFTYDNKKNPLIIKNEAVLLGRTGFFNANNGIKIMLTSTISPANDFTMDYVYKYNSSGQPDSSYATRTPGGSVTASKYFYQ